MQFPASVPPVTGHQLLLFLIQSKVFIKHLSLFFHPVLLSFYLSCQTWSNVQADLFYFHRDDVEQMDEREKKQEKPTLTNIDNLSWSVALRGNPVTLMNIAGCAVFSIHRDLSAMPLAVLSTVPEGHLTRLTLGGRIPRCEGATVTCRGEVRPRRRIHIRYRMA